MLEKFLLQGTPRLDKERAIDGFMRQLQVPFPRVSLFKPSCDLFRRPLMLQFARYDLCQGWIARQLARLVAACPPPRSIVGPRSPLAGISTVAVTLTADVGGGSTQAGDHAGMRVS